MFLPKSLVLSSAFSILLGSRWWRNKTRLISLPKDTSKIYLHREQLLQNTEDPDFQEGKQITLERGRAKDKKKRDKGFQDEDLCSGQEL